MAPGIGQVTGVSADHSTPGAQNIQQCPGI
jgi:hypothetical protein